MAERAGEHRLGQGVVAECGQGQHTGAIGRVAGVVVTLDARRRLGLGVHAVSDEHLGIGLYQGVAAGHTLFGHALLDGHIEPAGHEHPDNGRRDHLAAFVQRHDREVSLDGHNRGVAVKGRAIGPGHVIHAFGIGLNGFAGVVDIGGAVEPDILGLDIGLLALLADKTALAGKLAGAPHRPGEIPGHLGGAALGKGADMAHLAAHLAGRVPVQGRIAVRGRGVTGLAGGRIGLGAAQVDAAAADLVVQVGVAVNAAERGAI